MSRLELPTPARPDTSVVMVTHGASEWTRRALHALHAHTEPTYEVVIVDNASPDDTRALLQDDVSGARVLLNDDNEGFGPASNQGAATARGEMLLFLNSDALVHEGWLAAMTAVLRADPATGAVVPRFLNVDGSLQEAGALMARDGTVAQYGFGDDPARPEYRFPRTVDFGGGACLLVRRQAFETVGGFDPVYAPAYYEDADLCFALATRGLRTRYEPRAVVTHARYASGDFASARALSERHRETFAARWSDELIGRPETLDPPSPRAVLGARDARALDRVLVADDAELARALAVKWPEARITMLATPEAPLEDLLADGIEVAPVVSEERPAWLAQRRFHYDAVVAADAALDAALGATQPQAARLTRSEVDSRAALGSP